MNNNDTTTAEHTKYHAQHPGPAGTGAKEHHRQTRHGNVTSWPRGLGPALPRRVVLAPQSSRPPGQGILLQSSTHRTITTDDVKTSSGRIASTGSSSISRDDIKAAVSALVKTVCEHRQQAHGVVLQQAERDQRNEVSCRKLYFAPVSSRSNTTYNVTTLRLTQTTTVPR
eukprot:1277905-Pyramimonas_sp.AAC.1